MSTHCQGQWTCEDLPFIIFIPLSKNKTKITANAIKALTASEFILHKGIVYVICSVWYRYLDPARGITLGIYALHFSVKTLKIKLSIICSGKDWLIKNQTKITIELPTWKTHFRLSESLLFWDIFLSQFWYLSRENI